MNEAMPWTRRALWGVAPVHCTFGAIGLVMIWPMGVSYFFAGVAALLAEIVGTAVERTWRSRPDIAHRRLSWMLWITAALTPPVGDDDRIYVAIGTAAAWRLVPRDTRPALAIAIVVGLVCVVTWIWGHAFGRLDKVDLAYVVLYCATALPLAVFAIERAMALWRERRRELA